MKNNPYSEPAFDQYPVSDQLVPLTQWRTIASQKAKQGDYQGAVVILTKILNQNPYSSTDYNNRGLIYFKQGKLAQALQDYNRAISLNPRLDNAYNNRANYYICVGEPAKALQDYQNALNYNPTNFRALLNQGITYRELGLYDLALENFDLGLLLSSTLKERFYAERGQTYHLRGDWNSAIADYQRALNCISHQSHPNLYRQKIENWLQQLQPKPN